MLTKVKEILNAKGHQVWSLSPEATVFEGLEIMAEKNIGALIVMEDNHLVGIFSERDYARKVILKGKTSRETKIGELMTRQVYFVAPDMTLEDCMRMMTAHKIRHLPVMEKEQIVGILSIGDVVKKIISELQITVKDLENYITGKNYGAV